MRRGQQSADVVAAHALERVDEEDQEVLMEDERKAEHARKLRDLDKDEGNLFCPAEGWSVLTMSAAVARDESQQAQER